MELGGGDRPTDRVPFKPFTVPGKYPRAVQVCHRAFEIQLLGQKGVHTYQIQNRELLDQEPPICGRMHTDTPTRTSKAVDDLLCHL
jgi:hypothetical protein